MKNRRDIIKAVAGGLTVGAFLRMEAGENTSVKEFVGRSTARYALNPENYVRPEATEDLDLRSFMNRFTHQTDEMNGMYDVVAEVPQTIESERGDCVDYSAVASSWLIYHTDIKPNIIVYAPTAKQYGHINVYAGGKIYDYNGMFECTPKEFAGSRNFKVLYRNEVNA